MCSVVTNLVASLEFKPIRCATPLCHFGRTPNGYVATHLSATSAYVVVPERFGQNEEQANRNEEQTKKKPSFVPNSGFIGCHM